MKVWLTTLALVVGTTVPVSALDEGKSVADQAGKQADEKKESPIPRLAELRIDEYVVPARILNMPLPGKTKTVQEIMDRMEKWTKDDQIGAVLMDIGPFALSLPDVEALRSCVKQMQDKGKKVMAYLNGSGPEGYLLACAADEVVAAPTGAVVIPGLGRLFPFMKGHYQMLGIEFDVITAGRFKYPGFLNSREPNQYFQEEFDAILDSWIGDYKRMIAEGRDLTEQEVSAAVDVALFNATQAQQHKLVDTIAYYDEFRDRVLSREKLKRQPDEDKSLANVNSLQDFMELVNEQLRRSAEERKAVGPKIAVLHARGPIIDLNLGVGFASQLICRDDFSKVVDELRENKSIKAVVMHVDSPGGSGYASDVIWKHLRQLDEEKPLVVSMGSVAGSGGYYIACPARRIFAEPTTITGSIGVLGVLQSARSMFNRIDYELAEMKRGERALLGAPHREVSLADRDFIQKYIDDFYEVFIDRVAQTRKMPASQVKKVAEGRIWTGRDALEIGLVDELGGLSDAIEAARAMANIPASAELKIVHYPRPGSLGEIFESISSVSADRAIEMLRQGLTAAPPVTFEQQVELFTHNFQPLLWMAVPDFYRPRTAGMPSFLQPFHGPDRTKVLGTLLPAAR